MKVDRMKLNQSKKSNMITPTKELKNDSEISLIEIVQFVLESWKKLAIAAAVGLVLGLGGWFFLGSYSAEYVLLNNTNTSINDSANTDTNSYAIDLASWKALQKSLPNLAAQIANEGKSPEGHAQLYKSLSNAQWWQKNVVPSYIISKADTKELAGIGKDLEAASTTILSLTITAAGPTKEKSIENVIAAAEFLRTGSAYLQLNNMLNSYRSETISTVADLQKQITSTEIAIGHQIRHIKSLEDLHKRFPGSANVSQQVVDPKDSGAKYLPLTTQIIAANNEINQSKEKLIRLKDRLAQIALIKTFLEEALPLAEKTFNGLALADELLTVEARLRANLDQTDKNQKEALDQLHAQLLSVQVRLANIAPTSKKTSSMIKSAAGGLTATFFLVLLVMIGQKVWLNIKGNVVRS